MAYQPFSDERLLEPPVKRAAYCEKLREYARQRLT
jgi:hypothetical protein